MEEQKYNHISRMILSVWYFIEGKFDFHSKTESITIDQGQMLTLHENIKYRLISNEKSTSIYFDYFEYYLKRKRQAEIQ